MVLIYILLLFVYFLTKNCNGWCLDGDKGACLFNIRSKAGDNFPRSIAMYNNLDKLGCLLEYSPQKSHFKIFLDGNSEKDKCLHITKTGLMGIGVINAAPMSMGMLTNDGPPSWHPATEEIKDACMNAVHFCQVK